MGIETVSYWLAVAGLVYGLLAAGVAVWVLLSRRDQLYRERRKQFGAQYRRVIRQINDQESESDGDT